MAPWVTIENPEQPEVRILLARADAYFGERCRPERNYLLDVASLKMWSSIAVAHHGESGSKA